MFIIIIIIIIILRNSVHVHPLISQVFFIIIQRNKISYTKRDLKSRNHYFIRPVFFHWRQLFVYTT
jgi:hypothetical protein